MAHPYRNVLDRVEITFQAGHYHVLFRKLITPTSLEAVRYVFAKIHVSVFPDDAELTAEYYRQKALRLEEIDFKAWACIQQERVPLNWRVRHRYPFCLEIDVILDPTPGGQSLVVHPGQSLLVEYSANISSEYWGPYLERHVMRPVDRLEVHLAFPRQEIQLVEGCRYLGPEKEALQPSIRRSYSGELFMVDWAVDSPREHDRFRFYWKFSDQREEKLQQSFCAKVSRLRIFTDDGNSLRRAKGSPVPLSAAQRRVLKIMHAAASEGKVLHQSEILRAAGLKTTRLRDIFKRDGSTHYAWVELIEPMGRGRFKLKL